MRTFFVALTLATCVGYSFGRVPPPAAQPSGSAEALTASGVRARTEREWSVKAAKMRQHLLPLMRKHGIDLWVVMSRENVPDPVIELFGGLGVTGWSGHRNA